MLAEFIDSIQALNEEFQLLPIYHVMGSEDFAFISERVPSGYFGVGAGIPEAEKRLGQHNPKVVFNEDCLPIGAAAYAKVAMDWLEKYSE